MTHEDLPIGQQMEKAIGEAIADALGKFDKSFVIKWVTAVEVLSESGDRGVWSFTSSNAKRWDIFGMLKELEHYQTSVTLAEMLREEGI